MMMVVIAISTKDPRFHKMQGLVFVFVVVGKSVGTSGDDHVGGAAMT
jgi:hypothetical protein